MVFCKGGNNHSAGLLNSGSPHGSGTTSRDGADTIELHWPKYISLRDYLKPFIQADTIVNEIILPMENAETTPRARILFPAKKILSIKDVYLEKEYYEHKDWEVRRREIVLTKNSLIPFLHENDLLFKEERVGFSQPAKESSHYVLFSEGALFPSYQLAVTYIPDRTNSSFPSILGQKENSLSGTLGKLKRGEPLKIVFYGNSIEAGGNSSGYLGVKPYMPNWPQLVIYNLRMNYLSEISYKNQSKGGMMAKWGMENADERVANENPDLVVIAFGMNDGTFSVPVNDFISQIEEIMRIAKVRNPMCEFLLVTPMLANPMAIQSKMQEDYRQPLWKLANEHVAIADVTNWHKWLLDYKSYQDMTGNNINHPNDYLARWYAHLVSAILIPGSMKEK